MSYGAIIPYILNVYTEAPSTPESLDNIIVTPNDPAPVDMSLGFMSWVMGYNRIVSPTDLVGTLYDEDDPIIYVTLGTGDGNGNTVSVTNPNPRNPQSPFFNASYDLIGQPGTLPSGLLNQAISIIGPTYSCTILRPKLPVTMRIVTGGEFVTNPSGRQIHYKDDSWPTIYGLQYSFEVLSQPEIILLLGILKDTQGQDMRLVDSDDNYWVGQITSIHEPLSILGRDRKAAFNLIFEGVRE